MHTSNGTAYPAVPAVRAPSPAAHMVTFSEEQRSLIRDTLCPGAGETEFAVLMEIAQSRGLNPLLKQIYFVKRWDAVKRREIWATQVSIDGLRAIAERTGRYDGQDEPVYEYDEKNTLRCCKVRVYRKDWSRPAVGVAHWNEYVQLTREGQPNTMWAKFKHVMLAKCAEALALRKAFPEDMSGLYVSEEMGQHSDETRALATAALERAAAQSAAVIPAPAPVPAASPEPTVAEATGSNEAAAPATEAPAPTEAEQLEIPVPTVNRAFESLVAAFDAAEAAADNAALKSAITAANREKKSGALSAEEFGQLRARAESVKAKITGATH